MAGLRGCLVALLFSGWVITSPCSGQQPVAAGGPASQTPATVLPFGVPAPAARVPGFEVPLGFVAQETLEQRFDKRVYDRARESLRDRDRNRNDTLDGEELRRGDWNPPILESDLNMDGVIDLEELCMRYQNRELSRSNKLSKIGVYVMDPPPLLPSTPAPAATAAAPPTEPPQQSDQPPRWFGWFGRWPAEGGSDGDWQRRRMEFEQNWQRDGDPRGPQPASASPPPLIARSYRVPTPQERLPEGLPGWFYDRDADGDGQISMAEFLEENEWSDEAAEKFLSLDKSDDGLLSANECLGLAGNP